MTTMNTMPALQSIKWLNYISTWQMDNSLRIQLAALLEDLVDAHQHFAGVSDPGSRMLADILADFTLFSMDYFYYFIEAVDTAKELGDKQLVAELRETLQQDLRQVLIKIERELASLRIPIEQRKELLQFESADGQSGLEGLGEDINWLKISDAIATDILHRATRSNSQIRYCLTTFDTTNFARVNRWSYRPVATVAIPSTQMNEPWMWLGIPHEIAHYWYNNFATSSENGQAQQPWNWDAARSDKPADLLFLKDKLQDKLFENEGIRLAVLNQPYIKKMSVTPEDHVEPMRIWQTWLEEAFADIFGVLMLGPSYAHSLVLILLSNNSHNDLLLNDNDHPIAFLRPLMQVEALRSLAQYYNKQGRDIDEDAFLQMEKSLLGFKEFDLPNPGVIWQAAAGWMAGERQEKVRGVRESSLAKSYKTWHQRYEAWMDEPFGELKVQDYVNMAQEVVQLITSELFALADEGVLQFYTVDDHRQVRQAATVLAKGKTPAQEDELTPSIKLAASWYAWREITQGWKIYKDKGELPPELKPLAHENQRGERLNGIRKWLNVHEEALESSQDTWRSDSRFMDKMGLVIEEIRGDKKNEIRFKDLNLLLSTGGGEGYLNGSFARLMHLMDFAHYSLDERREFLLETDFSVQEFLDCSESQVLQPQTPARPAQRGMGRRRRR